MYLRKNKLTIALRFYEKFEGVLDKHAPLKTKLLKANHM